MPLDRGRLEAESYVYVDVDLQSHELKFKTYYAQAEFDWNDYKTTQPFEQYRQEIEDFLKDSDTIETYNAETTDKEDKKLYADICYRVGTYYNHIRRDPDLALFYLQKAERIYISIGSYHELAWTQNHLAYSYQQKLANIIKLKESKPVTKRNCARLVQEYCQGAKSRRCRNEIEKIKVTAFAECVRALTEYEQGNLYEALNAYRRALDLYERHQLMDGQYARAKNRWAMMLAENNQTEEAGRAFSGLEKYWAATKDDSNPYQARFYDTYGDFLSKTQPTLAVEQYKKAHQLLCITDDETPDFNLNVLQEKIRKLGGSYSPAFYKPSPEESTQPTSEQKTAPVQQRTFWGRCSVS